jgi:enoyl-[acyl-carrier protein] reductase III
MSQELSGKRALVTGGSRGIGAAISRAFASAGAEVVIVYRDDDTSAKTVVDDIRSRGGAAHAVKANLVHPEEIRRVFAELGDGPVHILVHAAALGSFKPVSELRANQWDLTMNVNARAFHLCSLEAARRMPHDGSIVALSSLGAGRVVPEYGAIGISKAALEATTRYLAIELGARAINVNAVSAGVVDNTSIHLHPHHDELRASAIERTPAKRLATPEDIAGVVLFLCTPAAKWIQGQVIVADGGMSLLL